MPAAEPMLFRGWSNYMKHRQIMVSAIVLKSSGWAEWDASHAKLLAVLLWDYEGRKVNSFKYSKTLKKQAYRRTHNYKLLNELVSNQILVKKGKGTYHLHETRLGVAEKAMVFIRQADLICCAQPESVRSN